jgi:hypothetical protein
MQAMADMQKQFFNKNSASNSATNDAPEKNSTEKKDS